jgi:GGDEF domain-containing protein
VGKIGISERILLKPGRLTDEEYAVIKLHPRIGYRLVQQVPALEPISLVILHHHERFDGRGYPAGLSGEEIPLEARIVGVADAFDAITSDRPYQAARSVDEALAELERCAGGQFDPEIVRHFVDIVRDDSLAPDPPANDALAAALGDPELELRSRDGEPIVGYGSVETTDHLTQLYSHRYFHEAVDAEAERAAVQGTGFTVAVIEVSEIEAINARDGYLAGDRAIQAAARAVEQLAATMGGTACRYGGRRLGVLFAGRELTDRELAAQVDGLDSAPALRVGSASWREGEKGEAVIARARLGLVATPT